MHLQKKKKKKNKAVTTRILDMNCENEFLGILTEIDNLITFRKKIATHINTFPLEKQK